MSDARQREQERMREAVHPVAPRTTIRMPVRYPSGPGRKRRPWGGLLD